MRRSKIILSSMITKFLSMDSTYHNYHMIEVIFKNIMLYASKNGLHIFPEELSEMTLHRCLYES